MRKTLLLICILTGLSDIYLAEASDPPQTANAAFHYMQAFGQMKFPESTELSDQLSDVIKNGWKQKHSGLEKVLDDNVTCLQMFNVGAARPSCDFSIGKKAKYLINEEFPPPVSALNLFYLALLKGRYLESQADSNGAAKIYLSVLNFSYHMSLDELPGSKALALAAENFSIKPLKHLIAERKIEKKLLLEIYSFLDKYEHKRLTMESILAALRDEEKSTFRMMADTFIISITNAYHADPGKFPEDTLKWAAAFRINLIRMSSQEIDSLYGNFMKAMETKNPQDWDNAHAEARKRKTAATDITRQNPKFESEPISSCFSEFKEKRSGACIQDLVTYMIAGNVAIPTDLNDSFDKSLVELQTVKRLALDQLKK